MEINVPVEFSLAIDVPLEIYKKELVRHCVAELDNFRPIVKDHISQKMSELLSESAIKQYVSDEVSLLIKKTALERGSSMREKIYSEIDASVNSLIRHSVSDAIENRVMELIDREIVACVKVSVRARLKDAGLDRLVSSKVAKRTSKNVDGALSEVLG